MGRVRKKGLIDPDVQWKSKEPRELAKEIATFMGGTWPERAPRKIQVSLDGVPTSDEELFELTRLNPTLIWEMTQQTRELFLEARAPAAPNSRALQPSPPRCPLTLTPPLCLARRRAQPTLQAQPNPFRPAPQVYFDDIQDLYSQVMETLVQPNLVTYDSLRKFKHLTISLSFIAVSDVCQAAFDATDFDEFPEVSPDQRPGLMVPLDLAEFTKLTAASTALVKMIVDAEGDLPPAAESRIIKVEKKWYYDDA